MIYYIIFSIIFFFVLIEQFTKDQRTKNGFFIITIIMLWLFVSLRWETGSDWIPYKRYFYTLDNIDAFELGYVIINHLVRELTVNYTILLLICNFISLFLIYKFMEKYIKNRLISMSLFYSYYFIINYFGANRRIIAIGLLFYSIRYIIERKKYKFVICVILAILFHRTAILFFPAYFISRNRYSNKKYIISFILFFMIGQLGLIEYVFQFILSKIYFGNTMFRKFEFYVNFGQGHTNYSIISKTMAILKRSFLLMICFIYRERGEKEDKNYNLYLNIYFISILIYIIFNNFGEIFKTISIYYSIVEIALISIIFLSEKRKWHKIFIFFILIIFMLIQLNSSLSGFYDLYIPYGNVIFEVKRVLY